MMIAPRLFARNKKSPTRQHPIVVRRAPGVYAFDQRTDRERARKARFQIGAPMQHRGDEHVAGDAADGIEMHFQHGASF